MGHMTHMIRSSICNSGRFDHEIAKLKPSVPRAYFSSFTNTFCMETTTCRPPAIYQNLSACCACQEKWHADITKCCACHKKSPYNVWRKSYDASFTMADDSTISRIIWPWKCKTEPVRSQSLLFHSATPRSVWTSKTCGAAAIYHNLTTWCTCQEKWHSDITKSCACHEKPRSNITMAMRATKRDTATFKCRVCHEKWRSSIGPATLYDLRRKWHEGSLQWRRIRNRSENDANMKWSSRTHPFAVVIFCASDAHFALEDTTNGARAIHPNFSKCRACEEKWRSNITKCCACRVKWHCNITKSCTCHETWHSNITKFCACCDKGHSNITKCRACHKKCRSNISKYCTKSDLRCEWCECCGEM